MSSARSDSSPPPRAVRGRGGGSLPQLVRPQWSSADNSTSHFPTPPGTPELRRADARVGESPRVSSGRQSNGVSRGLTPHAFTRRGRGGTVVMPPTRRAVSARATASLNVAQASAQEITCATPAATTQRRPVTKSKVHRRSANSSVHASESDKPTPQSPLSRQFSPMHSEQHSGPGELISVDTAAEAELNDYVGSLEAEREAMRRDNLLLRTHLADRQLLAEALEAENRELMQAQQSRQTVALQSSIGSMTELAASSWMNILPQPVHSSYQAAPQRNGHGVGPSPPISPTLALPPLPTERGFASNAEEKMHDLPLHTRDTRALQDRLAEMQRANDALRLEVAEQKDELQRLRALENADHPEQNITHRSATVTTHLGTPGTPPPLATNENSVETPSLSPPIDSLTLVAQLQDAQSQIEDLRDYIAKLQQQYAEAQKLSTEEKEILEEQLEAALAASHHDDTSGTTENQDIDSLKAKLAATQALADEAARTVAQQQEDIELLQAQVAEAAAAMSTINHDPAEAQHLNPNTAHAEYVHTVERLQDHIAKQDDDIRNLQAQLAKPNSVKNPLLKDDTQKEVQSLREQLTEREAEEQSLIDELAAAQKTANHDSHEQHATDERTYARKQRQQETQIAPPNHELAAARNGSAARGSGGDAVPAADVAALQRALDELRFHDERTRNYDATKPTTVSRHHREFDGDEWGRVVAERGEALKDAFCSDAANACHVSRDEIIAVSFRVGSLHVDFSVRHNQDVSEQEIDDRIAAHEFPMMNTLYANRNGPKTGLDAAQEKLAAHGAEVTALQQELAAAKDALAAAEAARADADAAAAEAKRADEQRGAAVEPEPAESAGAAAAEVQALKEQLAERDAEVAAMQQELAAAKDALAAAEAARADADAAAAEAKRADEQRGAAVEPEPAESAGAAAAEVQALKEQLAERDAEVAAMQQELAAAKDALAAAEAARADADAAAAEAKRADEQRGAAVEPEPAESAGAAAAEVQALKEQLAERDAEVAAMQQELAAAKDALAAAEAARADADAAAAEAKRADEQRGAAVEPEPAESAGAAAAEVQALKEQLAERDAEVAAMQQELAAAKDALAAAEAARADADAAAAEAKRADEQRGAAVEPEPAESAGAAAAEVQALKEQLAERDAEVAAMQQELAAAKDALAAAEAARADADAAAAEAKRADEQRGAAVEPEPAESAGAAAAEVQALKEQLAERDAEVAAMQQELAAAKDALAAAEAARADADAAAAEAKRADEQRGAAVEPEPAESAGAAAAEVQALKEQLAEQKAEVAAMQQELAAAKDALAAAEAARADAEAAGDRSAVRRQLENARSLQEAAARERADSVARREAAMDALKEKLEEQDGAVHALKEQLAAQNAEVEALQQELAAARNGSAARGSGGDAVPAADVAALQRALDELRFHDERARNYDATKPTTVSRHHREFDGDEWGRVVAERGEALKDAFCSDAASACHVSRDEIIAVSFRVGSLHVDFSVRHNQDVSEQEIDDRIAAHEFPMMNTLYANRNGPKTGLDAALEKLAAYGAEVTALQQELAAAKDALAAGAVDGRSAALDARMALLKSMLAGELRAQVEAEEADDTDAAALHGARADELRSAIVYAEAASSGDGNDVSALMERVDEHVEGVQAVQREIASRDEAVTALQEALVLARTAPRSPDTVAAAPVPTREALLTDLRKELGAAEHLQARKLRKAIADIEALLDEEGSVASSAESSHAAAGLREELAKQQGEVERLQQELQRARAAHQAETEERGAMVELYAVEVKAMQDQLSQAQAAEDEARLKYLLQEHEWKQAARQQLDEEHARLGAEPEALKEELATLTREAEAMRQEVAGLRDTVDEVQWYDERRDNCVPDKPMTESYFHRVFEGDEWRRVVEDYEEELRWMLHIDCGRACHVNLEHVTRVDFVLDSLHVDFCVQHNTDVAKSELRNRLVEYPFPATWGLYHRVVEADGPGGSLFGPSLSRAAEKLVLEEEVARAQMQGLELEARQEMTREQGTDSAHLYQVYFDDLMAELDLAGQERTDNLEHLEECAALLEEARESEQELRNRLFTAEEEMFEVHRKHDEEKRLGEEREESGRRAISESVVRLAEQDAAMQRQAEEIVGLQSEVCNMTETAKQKEDAMQQMRDREADLLRKLEDSAVQYAEAVKRLDKGEKDAEASRETHAALSVAFADLQAHNDELQHANEAQAEAHRVEMEAALAMEQKLKEATDVVCEFLPQLIAAASGTRTKDNAVEEDGTTTEESAFMPKGQLDANELREALLHHLGQIEQLRRDKNSLSDDLDAAEKLRNEYMASLENSMRALADERASRMRAHEQQVQLSQQLLKQITIMRNAEDDDAVDEGHDDDVASNYEPSSLCSVTPPF
ncbi:hypothetical protein ABB37_00132 [Leptomonas pyrrhocoris]|uniref:Flagellar attachment zone protein 1 conserved domain-containing protein n=1 Tax=Leptomonas pyrrhocoris TaxID=157538 RepID=A0A0M9G9S0_LEPPY|nr:hypothetical protein ABB37_00132 [Leptomonas pyrrhocoris]KPA85780.1 hypothetical protein ABB37_00132 [Leptomonas pyrrhocoris]|eukprot:XP_015664219.1 hypothetical protein ABB37_00132 [Leptomonas pyrrhocoris]